MRILLVTYWGLTNMGGIWTYMRQLADKLGGQGHTVTLMGSHVDSNTLYLLDRNAFDKKLITPRSFLIWTRCSFRICTRSTGFSALSWGVTCLKAGPRRWGLRIMTSSMPRTLFRHMR